MTNQEALTELRASIEGCGFQCHIETYRTAIEALEKQVPKAPVLPDNIMTLVPMYFCPVCSEMVRTLKNYCSNCGQALDWEDSNNENT